MLPPKTHQLLTKNNLSLNPKKPQPSKKKNVILQEKCAAAVSATAKMKKIDHTHAADASQLNVV